MTDLWFDVSGDGASVVLLHHGVVDSRIWDPVVPLLAERHRVVRYDQRGFGRSPLPDGPYSGVADLLAVLDAADLERAALVGCSLGGAVALTAAIEAPERVSSLVLVGAPLPGTPLGAQWTAEQVARWEAADEAGDYPAMGALDLEMWAPMGADEELRAMFAENAEGSNLEHDTTDEPAVGRLDRITAPTLVVVGARDVPSINATGERLAREIPGARHAVIDEADHMVPWRAPDELAELVLAHLDDSSS